MNWNDCITLVSISVSVDARGDPADADEAATVFCNRRTVGASEWDSARSAGYQADAEVEVRSEDYEGQQRAVLGGERYDVARAIRSGDFTRLTLARRLKGGD